MSARTLVCLFFVLIAAKSAFSVYSDEYFSIVQVEETIDDDGKITFTGEALNITEFQAIQPNTVFVTIKLQGVVLAVVSGRPDSYDLVPPGSGVS